MESEVENSLSMNGELDLDFLGIMVLQVVILSIQEIYELLHDVQQTKPPRSHWLELN